MRFPRLLLTVAIFVTLLFAVGAVSMRADSTPHALNANGKSLLAASLENKPLILAGLPASRAPGLLQPGSDAFLDGNSGDQGEIQHFVQGTSKASSTLAGVRAVAVPEPTALFFAGFAGCVLLAVAQRLRRSGARG